MYVHCRKIPNSFVLAAKRVKTLGETSRHVTRFCRVCVTPALVFSVVLSVLCLSFVSFCWPWSYLSSDLTISVCPFGIFEFLVQINLIFSGNVRINYTCRLVKEISVSTGHTLIKAHLLRFLKSIYLFVWFIHVSIFPIPYYFL